MGLSKAGKDIVVAVGFLPVNPKLVQKKQDIFFVNNRVGLGLCFRIELNGKGRRLSS